MAGLECRRHSLPDLTARQRQLPGMLAAGHTNAPIARRLGLARRTVRTDLVTSAAAWVSLAASRPPPAPSPPRAGKTPLYRCRFWAGAFVREYG
jgi:hypothetical protein